MTEWSINDLPGSEIDPAAVVVEEVAGRLDRPSGKRFGTLVHALLASISLDATLDEARELAKLHARLLVASDEERDVAGQVVHNALQHTRLAAARKAGEAGKRVMREASVSMAIGETVIDGQVDLAYETDNGWVIIDFKSDVELAAGGETYRRQVAFYVAAIGKATGLPAKGVILRV